ncbi:MAG: phosphoesterase PA-phosphatase related protein [Fibrobacteres bacterium]|nr:phosphoesterase PA-phosphatase related protein [Fibrobacterota bacterium]
MAVPALPALPAFPQQASRSAPSAGVLSLGYQDIAWASAAVLTAIPAQIRYHNMTASDTGALDRNDLWFMDRWAAGTHSPKAALASDLLIVPLVGLPMAVTAWESWRGRQGWNGAVSEAAVYSEALLISSSLDLLVRATGVHPRPLVYGKDVPADERLSPEASGSFYSGHSNAAFLSAVYFSYTYSLRNPGSRYQGAIWGGSLGAAAFVAGLRVAAGKHYLSDVMVGAAAGSFFGWAFPYMHRRTGEGETGGLGVGMNGTSLYPMLTWTF